MLLRLTHLWITRRLDADGLQAAVDRGWITPEDRASILALPQEA